MKLAKKLIALALVLCMVFCLSIAAFAAEGDTHEDKGTITLTKLYKLEGAGSSPAETIKLLQEDKAQLDGDTVIPMPDLAVATDANGNAYPAVDGKNVVAVINYADGDATADGAGKGEKTITITLPDVKDLNVGKYAYLLKEVGENKAGVTYHDGNIVVVITVISEGENKRISAVHTEEAIEGQKWYDFKDTDKSTGSGKKDTFTNTYSAGTLSLSKTVTGNLGDTTNKYFKFTLKLEKGDLNGKDFADSFTVSNRGSYNSNGEEAQKNPATVDFDTDYVFWLKHGDTITIDNIPEGVRYTITEADYSATSKEFQDGYTTTNTVDGDASKDALIATGNIVADSTKNKVAFTNTKEGPIDTGITLDSLPYLLALAFAFGGAVVLFTRKRRVED